LSLFKTTTSTDFAGAGKRRDHERSGFTVEASSVDVHSANMELNPRQNMTWPSFCLTRIDSSLIAPSRRRRQNYQNNLAARRQGDQAKGFEFGPPVCSSRRATCVERKASKAEAGKRRRVVSSWEENVGVMKSGTRSTRSSREAREERSPLRLFVSPSRSSRPSLLREIQLDCDLSGPVRLRPRCRFANSVASRPRGVRFRNPAWIRNGSYTSSSVPGSSPTATATVLSPTGPPANFSMMAVRMRLSISSNRRRRRSTL